MQTKNRLMIESDEYEKVTKGVTLSFYYFSSTLKRFIIKVQTVTIDHRVAEWNGA